MSSSRRSTHRSRIDWEPGALGLLVAASITGVSALAAAGLAAFYLIA
jgi:hypothetical protein